MKLKHVKRALKQHNFTFRMRKKTLYIAYEHDPCVQYFTPIAYLIFDCENNICEYCFYGGPRDTQLSNMVYNVLLKANKKPLLAD